MQWAAVCSFRIILKWVAIFIIIQLTVIQLDPLFSKDKSSGFEGKSVKHTKSLFGLLRQNFRGVWENCQRDNIIAKIELKWAILSAFIKLKFLNC
ncbi:hypothetical protein BFX06_07480 [Sulfobacillus thermosulfidooxidans]|nr:hypothetical protein BFX05_08430 [Sulfobacillus thermosulfidooxidans]OLZ14133.1 hypothetical protein BFX06_07480 [Sulfobacillus thermosulfidooxidans]OLZ18876.1 hypothetical protein BFX07_03875 [Sulfobacillus thermosulfidooxidans]